MARVTRKYVQRAEESVDARATRPLWPSRSSLFNGAASNRHTLRGGTQQAFSATDHRTMRNPRVVQATRASSSSKNICFRCSPPAHHRIPSRHRATSDRRHSTCSLPRRRPPPPRQTSQRPKVPFSQIRPNQKLKRVARHIDARPLSHTTLRRARRHRNPTGLRGVQLRSSSMQRQGAWGATM